jgi:hypothetical protein
VRHNKIDSSLKWEYCTNPINISRDKEKSFIALAAREILNILNYAKKIHLNGNLVEEILFG